MNSSALIAAADPHKTHKTSNGILYVNGVQTLSGVCAAEGNPLPTCVWRFCASLCTNVSAECNTTLNVTTSGNISCTAVNNLGRATSSNENLVVVPPSSKKIAVRGINYLQKIGSY